MVIRKRFGQHLLEPAWVEKVIRAIGPQSGEVFYEIGPGRGALTRPLAESAKEVVAFEIDRDLAAALRHTAPPTLTVVAGDFLESQWIQTHRPTRPVRVAGNLPYNVASPILFALIDLFHMGIPLVDATLMVQREVAARLTARPGTRDYGVLTILVRHSAEVEIVLKLPPGAFRPAPKVHSALVRVRFHAPEPAPNDPGGFVAMVQALFTRRRKTLANALAACAVKDPRSSWAILASAGIDGRRRPDTLDIAELVRLADALTALPETR